MFRSVWQDASPDNHVELKLSVVDGEATMQEAVFSGRHTGVLNTPSGAIPPTGKVVTVPIALALLFRRDKWSSFRIYFDVLELLTQLGITPGPAASV